MRPALSNCLRCSKRDKRTISAQRETSSRYLSDLSQPNSSSQPPASTSSQLGTPQTSYHSKIGEISGDLAEGTDKNTKQSKPNQIRAW